MYFEKKNCKFGEWILWFKKKNVKSVLVEIFTVELRNFFACVREIWEQEINYYKYSKCRKFVNMN